MKESGYLEGQNHLIARIRLIPVFAQFQDDKIRGLLRLSKVMTFEPGELIVREGARERSTYFLFSGGVQVVKAGKSLARLQRVGDVFGEMSLVDDGPRSATVRALVETTCLVIDADQLLQIEKAGDNASLAAIYKMFAQILAHRLRLTTGNYMKVSKELDLLKKKGI